jgi:transcriptional regulator with XRE-family HTH domain
MDDANASRRASDVVGQAVSGRQPRARLRFTQTLVVVLISPPTFGQVAVTASSIVTSTQPPRGLAPVCSPIHPIEGGAGCVPMEIVHALLERRHGLRSGLLSAPWQAVAALAKKLGARVRARRGVKGWSQAELAEAVGVGANYVGILERGQKLPTLDTLAAFAKALGCSPAELLDDGVARDPWADEVLAVASSVPKARRDLVLAVLRTLASA